MAGTITGGQKAAAKNLAKDPNFYRNIGKKGGSSGKGEEYQKGGSKASGWAANPEKARLYGAKGGRVSRKNKRNLTEEVLSHQ